MAKESPDDAGVEEVIEVRADHLYFFLTEAASIDLLQLRHHNCIHVIRKFALATLVAGSQYI